MTMPSVDYHTTTCRLPLMSLSYLSYYLHTEPGHKVATCPPGSQGACLDIISAYRNSPLLLAHKAYIASMWQGQIYIDHCAMEGLSTAVNIQGAPDDALIEIFLSPSLFPIFSNGSMISYS